MKTSKRALMLNPHYEEEIALKEEMMKTLLNIESKQNHIESMAEYLELKEKVYSFEPKEFILDNSSPDLTTLELDTLDSEIAKLIKGVKSIDDIKEAGRARRERTAPIKYTKKDSRIDCLFLCIFSIERIVRNKNIISNC